MNTNRREPTFNSESKRERGGEQGRESRTQTMPFPTKACINPYKQVTKTCVHFSGNALGVRFRQPIKTHVMVLFIVSTWARHVQHHSNGESTLENVPKKNQICLLSPPLSLLLSELIWVLHNNGHPGRK